MQSTVIKVCPSHGPLTLEDIKVWKWKNKTYRRCQQCIHDKNRRYQEAKKQDIEHIAKRKAYLKEYWENNKDSIKEYRKRPETKELRKAATEKRKPIHGAICRQIQQDYRDNLKDPYIKRRIKDNAPLLKGTEIDSQIIELYRTLLQLKRKIRLTKLEEKNGD